MWLRNAFWAGAAVAALASAAMGQNRPPVAPSILQPSTDRLINPANFLVETGPFMDPDAGDVHLCTDWEIWTPNRSERVWSFLCRTGVERIRAALSNGTFEGSLSGRDSLLPQTQYLFRVRHRDDSGAAATEWSPWSERLFTTVEARALFPLEADDALDFPAPALVNAGGSAAALPEGTDVVFDVAGGELLSFIGSAGETAVSNPGRGPVIGPVRVSVLAGPGGVSLPAMDASFTTGDGVARTVYLPAVSLGANGVATFWVAFNGSTYAGSLSQTTPDFTTVARGAPSPWTLAPGWAIDLAATGFSLPVAIEFVTNPGPSADSPLYYVAELYGTIRVVLRSGEVRTYATGLLNYNPNGSFPGAGEQGLGDIAYDPTTGDLYLTTLFSAINGVDNAPHYPAVDRLTSADGGLTMASRTRILSMVGEEQGQAHYISSITFGPDDRLYVHNGDGFVPETAQNLNSYRGKILRMLRSGAPAADNPLYNLADGVNSRDYIFSTGVRNPFGGAWRFSDSSLFFVENGPSVDRFARAGRNVNFGYDGSDASMFINAIYNWVPSTAPVNIGIVQAERFGGSGFPPEFFGRAYVSQFGGTFAIGPGDGRLKTVTEFEVASDGSLVSGPTPIAVYNGTGASAPVALTVGPDGVYFSDFFAEFSLSNPTQPDANIYRLRWVGLPPPPDCDGNGVSDADEIAAGAADCNGNGVPDACEIASGAERDCDGSGVLDSCEVVTPVLTTFDTSVLPPWRVNGAAARTSAFIRLTTLDTFSSGSLTRTPLSSGPTESFSVSFDFRIGGGSGADGFSFAAFDSTRYTGLETFSEEGPGSGNEAPAGPGTLTVQFDTFDNFGEGENTIALGVNGATIATYTPAYDLEDFQWRTARVSLRDGRVSVSIVQPDGTVETVFNRVAATGWTPFNARFGFGGRTGGLTNFHDIDNVTFLLPGPADQNQDGVLDVCEPCDAIDLAAPVGVLDFLDFLGFLTAFDAGNAAVADVTGNGSLDADDVLAALLLIANGCGAP